MKEHLIEPEVIQTRRSRFLLVLGVIFLILTASGLVFMGVYVAIKVESQAPDPNQKCPVQQQPCLFQLVESIPENLTYQSGPTIHPSTYMGIQQLIDMAQDTIEIASFYWTLRNQDLPVQDPSSWQGEKIFENLVFAGKEKGIKIRIVQSRPDGGSPVNDTLYLTQNAGADVRTIDFNRLLGSGILHTKMWLIDRKHFYLGSANLDWRSYTQVKEMGATVHQCDCLARDLGKIFDAYWYLATPDSSIPSSWPDSYNTLYNAKNPMVVNFNGTEYNTYLSSSPPPLCGLGRDKDGDAIVNIINQAEEYVHIAVMDYFPTTQFIHPRKYWPVIDDAIRAAAFDRHIQVRLLFSYWNNTWLEMFRYMYSLQELQLYTKYLKINIEVKLFVVPAYTDAQKNIPYSRVNHNKYMVTDKTAYIGTSNWSGDYFITTAGIGLAVDGSSLGNHSDIRQQLEDVFQRDWYSEHAFSLDHFNITHS
ncbi:5'-3' exonuclease PLD3-like [Mya arenaria]|uniref:5'-3' exonuclease PLD3-like n=1 Tax=Mya arenaria TaxID=6604 RepID=UPI0022DFE8FE|nr:5'-3' exonuclease PLD3-like [Mya arenaria]